MIDFAGLQWGKLRPTDIDLSLDWGQETFVFVEIKSIRAPLTVGQRIHLEGLVKAIKAGGKEAYAVLAKHDTKTKDDVMAQDCLVSTVFDGINWEPVYANTTLGDTLNEMYDDHLQRKTA